MTKVYNHRVQYTVSAVPEEAMVTIAECTFDRDACNWKNSTTGNSRWQMASLARRPSNLPDKTYGAPVGYAFFDVFNTGSKFQKVQMISPVVQDMSTVCLSFW